MPYQIKNITVYCSSSDAVDPLYFDVAEQLGKEIGKRNLTLVYGGANIGLMGCLARSAKNNGAKVIGVMPPVILERDILFLELDEFIKVKDMRERKAIMEQLGDAYIALPGGFGTLEEITEVLTSKQLQVHNKPIIYVNVNRFYEGLKTQFDTFIHQNFAKEVSYSMFHFVSSISELFSVLDNYIPPKQEAKWFDRLK